MYQNPQEEKNCALQGQLHEDPAQEIHLKGAHIRINAKVVSQVILDLIITEFYEPLTQAELRKNSKNPLEHVVDVLQILHGKREKKMKLKAISFL